MTMLQRPLSLEREELGQKTGVASGPGSRPTDGTASAGVSTVPASIPNALERPKRSDKAIIAYAAHKLAERIVEEWDHDGDAAEWERILTKSGFQRGGYQFARELERWHHVEPDLQLVEILEDADYTLDEAHEDALRKWVKITDWKPRFAEGDRVNYRGKEGAINGVQADVATYYFKPDDESERYNQGGGYVVTEDTLTASAIEARRAATPKSDAVHESAVPQADAQGEPS